MLKGTHVAFGIATAVALTRPDTLNETTLAITGGAIGGWIVDIDLKKIKHTEKFIYDTIGSALFVIVLLVLDFFSKNGIFEFITTHFGIRTIISLIVFAVLVYFGYNSSHRTFTHSILGTAAFSGAVFGFCEPLAKTFLIGYISHLFLDIFNERPGMTLLYPFKKRFYLNKVPSGGTVNTALFWLFLGLDALLIANGLIRSISANYTSSELIKLSSSIILGKYHLLQIYLVGMTVVSFILCKVIFNSYDFSLGYDYTDRDVIHGYRFLHTVIYLLNLAGGCLGCFFALIFSPSYDKTHRYFIKYWAFSYSCMKIWLIIYLVVCNPYNVPNIANLNGLVERLALFFVFLIYFPYFYIYLFIINLIGYFKIRKIGTSKPDEYSFAYKSICIIGVLGGTIIPFFTVLKRKM